MSASDFIDVLERAAYGLCDDADSIERRNALEDLEPLIERLRFEPVEVGIELIESDPHTSFDELCSHARTEAAA